MDEEDAVYSLYFENHRKIFTESIDKFFSQKAFLDVTLVCKGRKKLKAHRVVLAACSPLFENILLDMNEHICPAIVFDNISEKLFAMVLQFIYKGKIDMRQEIVPHFLEVAKRLQIRGLEKQYKDMPQETQTLMNSINNSPSPQKKLRPTNMESLLDNLHKNGLPEELLAGGKVPLRITTGKVTKVINPFALKRLHSDSDSTSIEDDSVPGPSRLANGKEVTSLDSPSLAAEVLNDAEDNDSDIQIIEEYTPSVVVISDTQIESSLHPVWSSNEASKNKKLADHTKPSSDLEECASDGSESCDEPKKKKRRKSVNLTELTLDTLSESEEQNKNDDTVGQMSDHENISDGSDTPEFITNGKDLPRAIISEVKEEHAQKLSESDYLHSTLLALINYCVICKTFKKNIDVHVDRLHNVVAKKMVRCETCPKSFSVQYALDKHVAHCDGIANAKKSSN